MTWAPGPLFLVFQIPGSQLRAHFLGYCLEASSRSLGAIFTRDSLASFYHVIAKRSHGSPDLDVYFNPLEGG